MLDSTFSCSERSDHRPKGGKGRVDKDNVKRKYFLSFLMTTSQLNIGGGKTHPDSGVFGYSISSRVRSLITFLLLLSGFEPTKR